MEFGEQIRKLRTDNHLSQEQFGEQLHVTRQAVSNRDHPEVFMQESFTVDILHTVCLGKEAEEAHDKKEGSG